MVFLEPIQSNFDFGQINVVLMTLVIADCVPRRTPWPRGLLLGVAIALKLTPAVFLLYFLLRRDIRARAGHRGVLVVATLVGFALAWRDSVEYWTETVRNTDRIGDGDAEHRTRTSPARWPGSTSATGARFALWTLACFAVLALTVWAVRRAAAGRRTGAGADLRRPVRPGGLAGLVVAPLGVGAAHRAGDRRVGVRRRQRRCSPSLTVAGVALMMWTPIDLLPEHHETAASLWRQLAGVSYVWWALAVILVAGTVSTPAAARNRPAVDAAPVHATS